MSEETTAMEKALACRELMQKKGWTVREMADYLNLDPSYVQRLLALLTLPETIAEDDAAPETAERT